VRARPESRPGKQKHLIALSNPSACRRGLGFKRFLLAASVPLALMALMPHGTLSAFGFSLFFSALVLESGTDFESMAGALVKKGMRAQAPAAIVGKSGVKHEFAFAVVPDSGKPKIVIDTELSVKEVDEMKVLKFYVKVFDVSPDKAVFCVTPKLGERAATLAKEYGIVVLENDTPKKLVPMAAHVVDGVLGTGRG